MPAGRKIKTTNRLERFLPTIEMEAGGIESRGRKRAGPHSKAAPKVKAARKETKTEKKAREQIERQRAASDAIASAMPTALAPSAVSPPWKQALPFPPAQGKNNLRLGSNSDLTFLSDQILPLYRHHPRRCRQIPSSPPLAAASLGGLPAGALAVVSNLTIRIQATEADIKQLQATVQEQKVRIAELELSHQLQGAYVLPMHFEPIASISSALVVSAPLPSEEFPIQVGTRLYGVLKRQRDTKKPGSSKGASTIDDFYYIMRHVGLVPEVQNVFDCLSMMNTLLRQSQIDYAGNSAVLKLERQVFYELVAEDGGQYCPFGAFRGRRSSEGLILQKSIRELRLIQVAEAGHVKGSDVLNPIGTWNLPYLRGHRNLRHAVLNVRRSSDNNLSIHSLVWAVLCIFKEQVGTSAQFPPYFTTLTLQIPGSHVGGGCYSQEQRDRH